MLHCVCSTSAQVFLRGAVCPILEGPLFLLNTFKSMLRFLKWCSTGSSWKHGLCTSVLAKASVPYLGRFASLATFLAPQHHLPFCPQYHTPYTHTQKHIPGIRKKTPYSVDTLTKNQNDNGDMFRKIVQDWIKQVIQISNMNFTLYQILTLVDSWSIR